MNLGISPGRPPVCRGWQQEGVYRLLCNVLAPDVAEDPYELVVYGNGKAVRDRQAFAALLELLPRLADDETLLVQSGKPVGVFPTHPLAPRVLMANAMLVPRWSNWEEFRRLEERNLTMYGQSTAASWAYIGAQGILQGTFETLWQVAASRFGRTLAGRLVLTSGLGGMGCAQPLAVEMNGGVAIVVEVDPDKAMRRLETNHVDVVTDTVEEAVRVAEEAMALREPRTIALVGNAAEVYEEFLRRGVIPDVVTDQTSAHDLLHGYVPAGLSVAEARQLRVERPHDYLQQARASVRRHVQAMLGFQERGAVVFEYGNHLRAQAVEAGVAEAAKIPSFISLFARGLLSEGTGPLRWLALSNRPEDIYTIDEWLLQRFSDDERLCAWLRLVRQRVHFQGLPARSAWLTYEQRLALIDALIEMVTDGRLRAPVAVTRDHFSGATMASPHRETEGMPDGSDAVADWPILNALLMASSGAALVSVQQGGGVGIGYSLHTGMTVVIDGNLERAESVRRALRSEVELGVIRYADAGYPQARRKAASFSTFAATMLGRDGNV
jgi:urocanate hydratase